MRRGRPTLLLSLAVLTLAARVAAAEPDAVPPVTPIEGHVTDPGKRLNAGDRRTLDVKIERLQRETQLDLPVFLVAERGLSDAELDALARATFEHWSIGKAWAAGALVVTADDRAVIAVSPEQVELWTAAELQAIVANRFDPTLAREGLVPALHLTIEALADTGKGRVAKPRVRPAGEPAAEHRALFFAATLAGLLFVAWRSTSRVRQALPLADERSRSAIWPRLPGWVDVAALTAAGVILRVWLLDYPSGALIFDESYYVQDARVLLGWPVAPHHLPGDAASFLDPNQEHPPLAKLLMALSMSILGDNGWGWRLPSVIFGAGIIPLLYVIARRLGGSHTVGIHAGFFWAFDNLSLVHGRMATLDISLVFFLLLGVWAYARALPELAGLALALATACKINAVFGLGALGLWELCRHGRRLVTDGATRGRVLRDLLAMGLVYLALTLAVLGLLDSFWTRFASPIDHLRHIVKYGVALSRDFGPQGIESTPWQWLINETQIPYLRVDEVVDDMRRAIVHFRGALNPFILFVAPLGVATCLQRALRRRDQLAWMALALLVATFTPLLLLWLRTSRISYIYYFLPSLPAVCLANALFMRSLRPVFARRAYLLVVLAGTWAYFPFRKLFY